jgi:hypothetical protein
MLVGTTVNGAALQLTITSYVLTTSEGHNLTANATGTVTSGGESCTIAITGNATR